MDKKLILSGRDLIKGSVIKGDFKNNLIFDAMPWQMVHLKEKTEEWKMWCADYFEWIGLKQVQEKQKRIIKNRRLGVGILDMEDYIIGGDDHHTYLNNMFIEQDIIDPLKKFYPLIPPFINVLHGEFLKRDRKAYVTCIDRGTEDEKLQFKMDMVNEIIMKDALKKKEDSLAKMGLTNISQEDIANAAPEEQEQMNQMSQQFQQEMEMEQQLVGSQQKFKKYRHIVEELGQLIFNKDYKRFDMSELEREAFVEMIINSEVVFHLDMSENDYKPEFIDNANSFHHTSESAKYFSQGDYWGFFEDVTVGDIINKDGRRLDKKQTDSLQFSVQNLTSFQNVDTRIIPDMFRNEHASYYDGSKKYPDARSDINKSQYVQNMIIEQMKGANNTSLSDAGLRALYKNSSMSLDAPKMYRRMVLYFRSQRLIGWLTKKDKNGYVIFQDWIDENFTVTEEPIYDNSLTKENNSENLIYGEHVDWEWTNEWRKTIKLSQNYSHPAWKIGNTTSEFDPIYIGGDPIESPYKGTSNSQFTVDPPFEGITFKMKGIRPVSFVETLAPYQLLTNICVNRVPDIIADDIGLALWINQNTVNHNTPGIESDGDPLENALDTLRRTKVLATKIDRDVIKEVGNAAPMVPQILNLSRINEAERYLVLASQLREMAGETVGISRQRMATPTMDQSGIQAQGAVEHSENITEPLFHQFIVGFMPRVYQKMIEAGMHYAAKSETARAFYQTSKEGNIFLEQELDGAPMRHFSVTVESDSKSKAVKAKLENFFFNNNTTDASMLEYVEGLIEDSPAQILENIREAQINRDKKEEQAYKQQQELQTQAEEAQRAAEERLYEQETAIQGMRNESAETQAMIRALGGLQSDNNQDGQLDAMQNLQNRLDQVQGKLTNAASKLSLDKVKHKDTMNMKERELLAKQSIEQKKLAAAIANSNKSDDKTTVRQIAKKQGVK